MVQTHEDSCEEGTTPHFTPQQIEKIRHDLKKFNICTIMSIFTGRINGWYGNCSASDRKAPQRVVRTGQYLTWAKLPAIQDL